MEGARRAAVPARPAGRGCFRRSRVSHRLNPRSPVHDQGGRGYARCSWAAAPFITAGVIISLLLGRSLRWWREIDAPTAAAAAWRGIRARHGGAVAGGLGGVLVGDQPRVADSLDGAKAAFRVGGRRNEILIKMSGSQHWNKNCPLWMLCWIDAAAPVVKTVFLQVGFC
jgi:hypothetical protein